MVNTGRFTTSPLFFVRLMATPRPSPGLDPEAWRQGLEAVLGVSLRVASWEWPARWEHPALRRLQARRRGDWSRGWAATQEPWRQAQEPWRRAWASEQELWRQAQAAAQEPWRRARAAVRQRRRAKARPRAAAG